ncbi:MAG: autotransporter outer membrane beta-barrel domain-containing protein, partial [Bradyrhizobium sp.]|nr:autotransporter outer membrane beta-barrel domain-containing protein [Bradyrhizobium sp.]
LNGNQRAVGDALTSAFNAGGGMSAIYASLTPAGLAQAAGQIGSSAQQTTFSAMSQFMGLVSDPTQRGNTFGGPSTATGYAEEDGRAAYAARRRDDAFAMVTKAPAAPFASRWSMWAAGFGGSQTTDGNAAGGSANSASSLYGTAVGADYQLSPNTLAGFALAGGGTNFNVTGQGWGRSDLFQAGAYIRHVQGPGYVAAALAYGWQAVSTDRVVTIAGSDHLAATFNANAYSARIEGGTRFVMPWISGMGLTPYAAAQVTTFDLPAYAERVVSGGGAFALAYAARTPTDTRTELGLRSDKSFAMQNGVLTLRGRLAWAHDFNPNRAAAATFQALPAASFIVNGAPQAADSALTTASAEVNWVNGWSAGASFEGEFSNVTRSYAGKGLVRYAW